MTKKFYTFIILISTGISIFGQSNSIEIWIRSFIPNVAHAGAASNNIFNNSSGSGSFVQIIPKDLPIVGPIISAIAPSSCFDPDKDRICFITDNRGFSSDPNTTARTDTKFTITFNTTGTATISPTNGRTTTGVTKRLNCTNGVIIEQKAGKIDRDALGAPAVSGDIVQVIGQVSATDQLVPCAPTLFTPSADCSFDLIWNRSTTELTVNFTFGVFPAFEIYARQPGNDWVSVFQQLPTGEAWQLAGDATGFSIATIRKTATVKVPGLLGKWQSQLPEQRFTLDILGNTAKWTERNSLGALLIKQVPIQDIRNGNFRIERANDDEILTFLGFQPNLRREILARNPQPSFIVFHKNGDNLIVEWNGLIATKDANARLRELIQPGIKPPKIYELTKL